MSIISSFIIEYHDMINLFFAFSFLGWIMECLVIRREKGHFENRGFVKGPFCVIYGFGAMTAYLLMRGLADRPVELYLLGAVSATTLEYFTARLMLRFFGRFWWDYEEKPYNYRGMICLESTVGWGFVALLIVRFLYGSLLSRLEMLPDNITIAAAALLFVIYTVDFFLSLVEARRNSRRPGSSGKAGRGYDFV